MELDPIIFSAFMNAYYFFMWEVVKSITIYDLCYPSNHCVIVIGLFCNKIIDLESNSEIVVFQNKLMIMRIKYTILISGVNLIQVVIKHLLYPYRQYKGDHPVDHHREEWTDICLYDLLTFEVHLWHSLTKHIYLHFLDITYFNVN